MRGLELLKETTVVFGEHSEVVDLIFEVGDALHTHSEGETAVDFRVDAARVEHIGIDHAASENLDPAGSLSTMNTRGWRA